MFKTIGLFAHVDAGKTTLAEQLLVHAGALKTAGRVDHRDAFMDHDPIERERGITIFAEQAHFTLGEDVFTLIDTPGHADFSAEMERCIAVMDLAVILVSAVEGVQAHTQTVWHLLRRANVPVVFFINKVDRVGADADRVILQLQRELGAPVCAAELAPRQMPDALESVREFCAQEDETLLERYLAGESDAALWQNALQAAVKQGHCCLALRGAALQGQGVDALLAVLARVTPAPEGATSDPFGAKVYRIRHGEQGQRLVFLRLTGGVLRVKDALPLPDGSVFKVNELRRVSGERFVRREEAVAGEYIAVVGLPAVRVGDGLGVEKNAAAGEMTPLLQAVVAPLDNTPLPHLLAKMRLLEEEDPQLRVVWVEEKQELRLSFMGQIQPQVLTELLQGRYGMQVRFGEPSVLYRETLAAPVIGRGHYEPLRHYAEVKLRLAPLPRGSGIVFKDEALLDDLAAPYHTLIGTHVLEKTHLGALTGSPLTDVEITLLAGRAHLKHTEGGDFREATYRAIRQGLFLDESVLLEPYYAFAVRVEAGLAGRVSGELTQLGAALDAPEQVGEEMELSGRGAVNALKDYPAHLTALTKGRGRVSFRFDGYEPVRGQEAVVSAIGYDREADRANPADSVFCAKGAGFMVKWDKVGEWAHLP